MSKTAEIPEALQPFAVRFAQRGPRAIYQWDENRDVRPELKKWPVEGLEFADAEVARKADFRRHTFGLHHFTSWSEGEAWMSGEGGHDSWRECPDCFEIRALYDNWRSEDYE